MSKVSKTKVVSTTTQLIKKHFWHACHVPDSVAGNRDKAVRETDEFPSVLELALLWETNKQQIKIYIMY